MLRAAPGSRLLCVCLILVALSAPVSPRAAGLRVGFVDPAAPGPMPGRNAAAFAWAQTQGSTTRLQPLPGGGFQAVDGRVSAPEEFDVLWYHEAENTGVLFAPEALSDLLWYLKSGGTLLLSGAAGRLLNDLGLEPTNLRLLSPSGQAYASGLVVPPAQQQHPAFAALDASHPILLTTFGGNALADFYGTAGPHGTIIADGNCGVGERPVVEYAVGEGRVIMVGWRLADFTTASDQYRPNLERFYGNLLGYLAGKNTNHMQMVAPPGGGTYARLAGVPFLLGKDAALLQAPAAGMTTAVTALRQTEGGAISAGEGRFVSERPVGAGPVQAAALGLTLAARERPASRFVAARQAEQQAADAEERQRLDGLRVVKPAVQFTPGPLQPSRVPDVDQSVLLGRSPFMAPGGDGKIAPVYESLEDGGFRISGSKRQLNRPVVHGQNRVWTGDAPLFRMDTTAGNGCYSTDRIYPIFPRPDAAAGNVYPCLGTLRLGVRDAQGQTVWLDQVPATTTFRPGYTAYRIEDANSGVSGTITIAPALDCHGFICRVDFARPVLLVWQYGGLWWQESEGNANHVAISGGEARITEANLPNALVVVGWDAPGTGKAVPARYGEQAEFTATAPRQSYNLVGVWGVTAYDEARAQATMARLDTPNTAGWAAARDRLKQSWFDCYIGRALHPEEHFRSLSAAPAQALQATRDWWDRRRNEFQVHTPDPQFNALMNWTRCTTEYHRQGPGLVLGVQFWIMYSHISTGWYGKEWGGDHAAMEECLRLYGALQGDDGFIRWVSPSLVGFSAEDNTPYWVDQVWRHYTWTGDKQFLRDLWPAVQKAVAWMRRHNDPDDDGLFRDFYEYWNCDSNGKGPKAATPSAMAWAMLDRAARIAAVLGDAKAGKAYRVLADRTRAQIMSQLWREAAGRLGSIGADGLWRGHPQTWEEYLAINAGLLSPDQARRAMRWLEAHYGFAPQPGVKLLSCSDWFPLRWSCQWVPTGDTCLAALAGMKSGDVELWWPYLKTVVGSAFQSGFPGINMGISNAGAGGGDREDVDSVDPHCHVAVRGLFGVEPALDQERLDICPAFPTAWREAAIKTPDVSYTYRRVGQRAEFRIHTPRPTVKHVRAHLTGPEVVTKAETDSTVTVPLGPAIAPPPAPKTRPILAEQEPPTEADTGPALASADHIRQVLFDLSGACNRTAEELSATQFVFDASDGPQTLAGWWGNPALTMPPTPRVLVAPNGVTFLTSGKPQFTTGPVPKQLLALASWRPNPLPGGATIPVGLRCEGLWLLLQSYVHPMKNYVPNGEVVLHYADGTTDVTQLIPPLNLDCYFQHFSRQGVPVPLGNLGPGGFVDSSRSLAHADALHLRCAPDKLLASVELRATCGEAVIGLAGMTALAAR